MQKTILDKQHVQELIFANKYPVDEEKRYLSRCIDGRYKNENTLPALALPGADAGELALIIATVNEYGLEIDEKKFITTLTSLLGGVKNFNFHSDDHADPKIIAAGCGHIKQISLDPEAYSLEKNQTEFIKKTLIQCKKDGAKETILGGEHKEGAFLQVRGNYGILPKFFQQTQDGRSTSEVFIFHETLVSERHRELAKKLIADKAVKLPAGCDHEYFYEVLSEMTDLHLFETVKRLASGLPIFLVVFAESGSFTVEEMGKI